MRWADTDIYGHMNNAVHYTLFDTAVAVWVVRAGLLDLGGSATVFLMVQSDCAYFEEITFADQLEVGLRIARLGTSSIRYDLSLFRNGSDSAAATGGFTHVNVDRKTSRPVAIRPEARTVFAGLM